MPSATRPIRTFQKDMLMTVQHAVERMNRLLLQLRSGAAPVEKPRAVELDPLIQRVIAPYLGQSRSIAVDVEPGLRALGHDERLERVLGHLVQNAVDATRADGRIWVGARREGAHCVIEVADDGQGMSPDFVRDHLFKPFHSTKSAGMGIGAYESHQYVSELGGRIAVHSTVDAGTRIGCICRCRLQTTQVRSHSEQQHDAEATAPVDRGGRPRASKADAVGTGPIRNLAG